MIEVAKTISTTAPPAKVMEWFMHFDKHYVDAWPEAHKEYRYMAEGLPGVGTTFCFVQVVKGRRRAVKGVITKIGPTGFEWKMKPLALMGGGYRFRPLADGGTEITQTIRYGPTWPVVGGLVTWIMERLAIPRSTLAEFVEEEMARLKQELEAGG
ncbi:MAG: SRPBCC family protein [Dehalococcoidia bacterium]|nr:SRPBCC family protein [Dehalococcoidia bacterium]